MSAALERQVLAGLMQTYATANNLPVAWPNRAFNKPTTGPWVRFTVIDSMGSQIETGSTNNTHRVIGSLILQVFYPVDQGDGAALDLANTLGMMYRQKVLNFPDTPSSGLVRTRDPTVRAIGDKDSYYQINVTVPFHRDEIP